MCDVRAVDNVYLTVAYRLEEGIGEQVPVPVPSDNRAVVDEPARKRGYGERQYCKRRD